jgi:DNA-binding SARP family transcriptional activator
MRAEVCLLGPLEVSGPDGPVSWHGARRRSVFALFALRTGRLVSCSSLIDALWGDAVPATALKTVQGHVAHVRKALSGAGLGGLLVTRGPGYLLQLDPVLVDVHRFDQHARAGRQALDSGDAEQAIERFEAGLEGWHGDPLADCPVTGWAAAEIIRLCETRALVEEHLITALCRLGRDAEAIAELEHLVTRYPFRERLWELLMIAQYRAGRSAEALRTYRRVRGLLVDEFGLEPGPALRRLESAVLSGDPELNRIA